MEQLKAIETKFDGHRFRSRTEARWAVFFREIGLNYEYEKEGYILPSGKWYLPDFWLPDLGLWFECKGLDPSVEELEKTIALCSASQKIALFCLGPPNLVLPDRDQMILIFWDKLRSRAQTYADNITGKNTIIVSFRSSKDGNLSLSSNNSRYPAISWENLRRSCDDIEAAYRRAAYARFEHGENP